MRSLFTACLLFFSVISFAQKAKPFKMTFAGGFAAPAYQGGDNQISKSGVLYSVEPQYELRDHLEVGFRFEQAFIKRPEFIDANITFLSKANSTLSVALTANYVLGTIKSFKPYIGAGAGLYYVSTSEQLRSSASGVIVNYPLPTTLNIGGLGRIGVKYKFIHVEAAYNLVGDTSVKNSASNLTLTAKNSYFSLKAGITIGGSQ